MPYGDLPGISPSTLDSRILSRTPRPGRSLDRHGAADPACRPRVPFRDPSLRSSLDDVRPWGDSGSCIAATTTPAASLEARGPGWRIPSCPAVDPEDPAVGPDNPANTVEDQVDVIPGSKEPRVVGVPIGRHQPGGQGLNAAKDTDANKLDWDRHAWQHGSADSPSRPWRADTLAVKGVHKDGGLRLVAWTSVRPLSVAGEVHPLDQERRQAR